MNRWPRLFNALLIIVLMGVICGAYFEQYKHGEKPCPLCLLQRLAMIGIAFGSVLNLKFGVRASHYGLSLLFVALGRSVSLRQISLHVCPGFPTFGIPVFGLSLYTWAFLVFFGASLTIAILLFFCSKDGAYPILNWFEKITLAFFVLVVLANVATTFLQCGFGPCEDIPWPQEPPSSPS